MERIGCNCEACQNACKTKPGWMKYGDEQIIAKHMNITVKELFDKYLMVDYWTRYGTDQEPVFILSPAITKREPGTLFPNNPRGMCVLYQNGLCAIHAVAPYECQQYIHTMTGEEPHKAHEEAMESWDNPEAQQLIADLLGYKPIVPEPTFMDILELLGYLVKGILLSGLATNATITHFNQT